MLFFHRSQKFIMTLMQVEIFVAQILFLITRTPNLEMLSSLTFRTYANITFCFLTFNLEKDNFRMRCDER